MSDDGSYEDDSEADYDGAHDDVISAHPRIRARRAEVEDESLRSRNRRLVAMGVFVLLVLLAVAATQSPLLDVDEIEVVGASEISADQLRAIAGIELGAPLIGFDGSQAQQRLGELPEIRAAMVTRDWGGIVTIEVAERMPVARIIAPEGTIVVAADGMVLSVSEDPREELVAISGAMFVTSAGEQVPAELDDALLAASDMPTDIVQLVDRIEITVDSLVLRMTGGGSIALGDARDLETKFDALRAFLAQVDLTCLETLNVSAPRVPVIVRSENCV